MRAYYSAATREKLRNTIDEAHRTGTPFEQVTHCNIWAKIVVLALTGRGVPFKVLQMGAGVKKITTQVDTCPKCKGLGKC